MGCCGEPNDDAAANATNPPPPMGIVTNQPTGHPGLEKPQGFLQPSISPLPSAQLYGNGQQQASWTQTPVPTTPVDLHVQQFGAYPSSPPPGSATLNGSPAYSATYSLNDSIMRPAVAHGRNFSVNSVNPQLPNMSSTPSYDEGKMSISIDFGMYFSYSRIRPSSPQLIIRNDLLWCCEFTTYL